MAHKINIFILLILFITIQQAAAQLEEDNLYYMALSAGLDTTARHYADVADGRDRTNIIFERDDDITQNLPAVLGRFTLTFMDYDDMIERYRASGARVPISIIRPLANVGATLLINIEEYWVSIIDNRLTYTADGGWVVSMRFDCATGRWRIEDIRIWKS